MILGLIPNFRPCFEVNACDTQTILRQKKGEGPKSVAKVPKIAQNKRLFLSIAVVFFQIEEIVLGGGDAGVTGLLGVAEVVPKAVDASAEDGGVFFRDDVGEGDDIGIEVDETPVVVVFMADGTEAQIPYLHGPQEMAGLGTEITQALCLLSFAATALSTTDGVDFTVHHLTEQTGFEMGDHTSGCAAAHPVWNTFSFHCCQEERRQAVKPVTTWRRGFSPMALGLNLQKAFSTSAASICCRSSEPVM